jgi:hypothetical protein
MNAEMLRIHKNILDYINTGHDTVNISISQLIDWFNTIKANFPETEEATLKKWEAGSEPPDGLYAVWFPRPEHPCRFVRTKGEDATHDWVWCGRQWYPRKQLFDMGGVFWGPFPDPKEVKAARFPEVTA